MTTNVSANLASLAESVRTVSVCVSLNLVRVEECVLYPAALQWDTPAHVSLVMLGLIVKESCPVGSCPATMVVAVHSPKGGCVAPAIQVMVDPSASIAAMKAAPPSPARMEGCALKKQASHTFTASVPVAGQENGVSRTSCPTSLKYPYAL